MRLRRIDSCAARSARARRVASAGWLALTSVFSAGSAARSKSSVFPAAVPSWYIVPALVTGNTIVWKPAEQTAAIAQAMAEIFYAGGVKANVLFFDKRPAREDGAAWTEQLWVYDFRTNQHFTMKQNPLRRDHLDEFVDAYKPGNRGKRKESERFKAFTYEEIIARDKANLDIIWLKDDSLEDAADLPAPEILAREIMEELQVAIGEFTAIVAALGGEVD